ncbi:MAG: aldo/keto reductase [Chloroflexi bacterium]|nr:MAG: aldo/keto reductase [Chloroflexota bacterium]
MPIPQRTIGRTGLSATILGLGGGGNSRLGLSTGQSEAHAADVVRAALDLGVTLFDTARVYGTECAVGQALRGRRREQVVLSSKSPYLDEEGNLLTAQAFAENIDTSLQELGVKMIDIYFIHGLQLPQYAAARERFLPVLEQARQAGKIRFTGVTEAFERDTRHEMLQRAVLDGEWDVFMVGFNLLNQSARERVLAVTRQTGAGTLGMFAVRRGLIDESRLRTLLGRLAEEGEIDPALAQAPDLMERLGLRGVSETLSEAAYRFASYEPGMDCVLSGTSSAEHLQENLASVQRGPLPERTIEHLRRLFGRIDSISAQVR